MTQGAVSMEKRSKLKRYEYQDIYEKYFELGWSQSEIAVYLSRSRSTISRALSRDLHPSPLMSWYQKAMHACDKSHHRMSRARRRLRLKSARIRNIAIFLLCRKHWSPEEISFFLKQHKLFISAKAIYNFIKKERKELKKYLRLRGKHRRQRVAHPRSAFKIGLPAKRSIHQRPEITGVGHWEIDTIHSIRQVKVSILTLRELGTKKCFYFLIPDLTTRSVMEVLVRFFHQIPACMRLTLTSDNGSEFVELYKLEKIFKGFKVYYCDPYKACQRGSVENANGELRWYYPKKTDFSLVTAQEIRAAEYKINSKPIRANNGVSPIKAFNQFLKAAA